MENMQQNQTKEKIKLDFKDANYATVKRKTSIAKIWLKKGSCKIIVNGKDQKKCFEKFLGWKKEDIIIKPSSRFKSKNIYLIQKILENDINKPLKGIYVL